ncbi:hypothetical protein TeGR_g576 [Tetraparma gracilis]|jgi:hypothetical protein|uniref:Uncharacterized protein n=1 Tax=Tetraparma gracilis TaxID=2962635 RepID=A0ABQ6N736_9STRA|nr:hypothetical protein TeGR_g576 [Tetraparma gracilis]
MLNIDTSKFTSWNYFFLAAGASNILQSVYFYYGGGDNWKKLGYIGSKAPTRATGAIWHIVAASGAAYTYNGLTLALPFPVTGVFSMLKFSVAGKMSKIMRAGKPAQLTAFIGITEVLWGAGFACWSAQKAGLIKK